MSFEKFKNIDKNKYFQKLLLDNELHTFKSISHKSNTTNIYSKIKLADLAR